MRCGAAPASSAGVVPILTAARQVPKYMYFQAANLSASKKFILQGLFPSAKRKHVIYIKKTHPNIDRQECIAELKPSAFT